MTGEMPQFVYGVKKFRDIPVFCFHEAELPEIDMQFRFIRENGYRTLNGDELLERLADSEYENDGKDIVLTFDDALTSVWTTAYPLLQAYECKIMLFVIAGLVPDAAASRPHIDIHQEPGDEEAVATTHPLCNWREIREMHDSGFVDVQSHGLIHSLVSISPKVADFASPEFDPYYYGNIHVPLYDDGNGALMREVHLGQPVYESDSRLGRHLRYLDCPTVRQKCARFVEIEGGKTFFQRQSWRNELAAFHRKIQREEGPPDPAYESEEARITAIREELRMSRSILETRLPSKNVRHFCFPWFKASVDAYRIASEAGYTAIHIGAIPDFDLRKTDGPLVIQRLEKEYILSLPGKGRRPLPSVLKAKIQLRRNAKHSAKRRAQQREK
jgi:peptidoglycan/xylan/chitin deacetylase (PgdA/CDA1 family)